MLAIALGGALGALGRYGVTSWAAHAFGRAFPYGTLAVNVIGSLVLGFLLVVLNERSGLPAELRGLLLVGFLGAFTTFSTFSMDTVQLLQEGAALRAGANVFLNVSLCVGAAWLGYAGARHIFVNGM